MLKSHQTNKDGFAIHACQNDITLLFITKQYHYDAVTYPGFLKSGVGAMFSKVLMKYCNVGKIVSSLVGIWGAVGKLAKPPAADLIFLFSLSEIMPSDNHF